MHTLSKLAIASVTVFALLAATVALAPANEAPPADGANVFMDFNCAISLAPIGGGFVITDDTHAVVTPNGNTQFKCTGVIPPGLVPNKAVKVDNLGCFTQGGFTPSSMNLYTPSGKVQLTCTINGST